MIKLIMMLMVTMLIMMTKVINELFLYVAPVSHIVRTYILMLLQLIIMMVIN